MKKKFVLGALCVSMILASGIGAVCGSKRKSFTMGGGKFDKCR